MRCRKPKPEGGTTIIIDRFRFLRPKGGENNGFTSLRLGLKEEEGGCFGFWAPLAAFRLFRGLCQFWVHFFGRHCRETADSMIYLQFAAKLLFLKVNALAENLFLPSCPLEKNYSLLPLPLTCAYFFFKKTMENEILASQPALTQEKNNCSLCVTFLCGIVRPYL